MNATSGTVSGRGQSELLWSPAEDAMSTTVLGHFLEWLATNDQANCENYEEAWQFSITDPSAFWAGVRDFFALPIHGESTILDYGTASPSGLPGARWFPDATLNATEVFLSGAGAPQDRVALVCRSQTRNEHTVTFGELRDEVARVRRGLVALGVVCGDCVAAYAPNIPETLVAFLATVSIGAIFTSCAPEFGIQSVLDRFGQTRPKVLFAIDGYRFGSRTIDRTSQVQEIVQSLDSLQGVVHIPYLDDHAPGPAGALPYGSLDGAKDSGVKPVPFDHPLWVLYSSGTTGLPKAIVHSHGGIVLEHHKALALQSDIGPKDRFFWFTTTGWMMWNYLISGLAVGASIVLFDGDPAAKDLGALFEVVQEAQVTAFGGSAPFFDACRKRNIRPNEQWDLKKLRWLGSTGAPLLAETAQWLSQYVGKVPISSISGGTDVCTAFVGGSPLSPVRAGVIPCRFLGADVHAYDETGQELIGREGELVVTTPMPSMPIGFWNDRDGTKYRNAYFSRYENVWWHGDWITIAADGSCVISGRSDATLNRGGVRLGTADFYRVCEALPEVTDSLVIHNDGGGRDELLLFVVLASDTPLDDALRNQLRSALRQQLSPRHVPDEIIAIREIPHTLSGKKTEVPVKRVLAGEPVDKVIAAGALANATSLEPILAWAATR